MSAQDDRIRAEKEVNPILQKAIVVHHIIHMVAIIICIAVSVSSGMYMVIYALPVSSIPVILFIIFWIASRCNMQNFRVIFVHFNPLLSTLWFISIFPVFVLSCIQNEMFASYSYGTYNTVPAGASAGVVAMIIITGLLSCSSAIFAVSGIWKAARNVALSAGSAGNVQVDGVVRCPPPYETPVTFTDLNNIRLPPVMYGLPNSTQ